MAFKISNNLIGYNRKNISKSILIETNNITNNNNNRKNINKIGSIIFQQKRNFAEGEEIRRPKVYKNVFNKWTSRDGKRVYFTTYPHDFNEPWPFPPVYNKETGEDLNKDDVWGDGGEAPPCSITGKPKRALGHYPWLGRPIVPYDDHHRWLFDDHVAPMPLFAVGRYEANRTFWWQWILFSAVFWSLWYIVDKVWRGDGKWGNLATKRDELFFTEHMASPHVTWGPLGWSHFANPTHPILYARGGKDRWCVYNNFISNRFDHVFIPAAKEDMFANESPNYFDMPGYNC